MYLTLQQTIEMKTYIGFNKIIVTRFRFRLTDKTIIYGCIRNNVN